MVAEDTRIGKTGYLKKLSSLFMTTLRPFRNIVVIIVENVTDKNAILITIYLYLLYTKNTISLGVKNGTLFPQRKIDIAESFVLNTTPDLNSLRATRVQRVMNIILCLIPTKVMRIN